jgi:hypothetical protein
VQSTFDIDARQQEMYELQRKVLRFHGPVLHLFDSYNYSLWWPWVHNYRPGNIELNFYNSEIYLTERT